MRWGHCPLPKVNPSQLSTVTREKKDARAHSGMSPDTTPSCIAQILANLRKIGCIRAFASILFLLWLFPEFLDKVGCFILLCHHMLWNVWLLSLGSGNVSHIHCSNLELNFWCHVRQCPDKEKTWQHSCSFKYCNRFT